MVGSVGACGDEWGEGSWLSLVGMCRVGAVLE